MLNDNNVLWGLPVCAGKRENEVKKYIYLVQRGGTAAVVTHRNKKKAAAFGQLLSDSFGVGVADGDRHDLRFLDKGKLVTLTAKGSMKEESKFVWTREQFDKLAG